MKIGNQSVKIFKMKNRKGYAAICDNHVTEGNTTNEAFDRMVKAIKRTSRRNK